MSEPRGPRGAFHKALPHTHTLGARPHFFHLQASPGASARLPRPLCLDFRTHLCSATQSLGRVQGSQVSWPPPSSGSPTTPLCLPGGWSSTLAFWGKSKVGWGCGGMVLSPFLAPPILHLPSTSLLSLEHSLSGLESNSSSIFSNVLLTLKPQKPTVFCLYYLCSTMVRRYTSLAAWART